MSNVLFVLFRKSPWLQSLILSSTNKQHTKRTKLMTVRNYSLIMLKKLLKFHLQISWKKLVALFSLESLIKGLKKNWYKQLIFNSQLKEYKIFSRIYSTQNKFPDKKLKKFSIRSIIDFEAYNKIKLNKRNFMFVTSFYLNFSLSEIFIFVLIEWQA